jgi:conjugative transfer pilus assembly protein TraH
MFAKKQISIAIAALMLVSMPVSANVGTGMNDLFNSVGGFANATPPSAYKGQTMNGYSGGGFYARTPVKNYQLMTAQAPSLNIGCGGIDLTAGSFSHINEAALTAMLQNIGTSLGYAFLLAIKSSMPEMASLFEYLQDAAAKANAMNINTCQLSKGVPLVEGGSLSQNLRATAGQIAANTTSLYSDSMQALKATKDDAAKQNEAINAAIAADPSKKEFYKPGNVVWRALSKTSGLDREDKEFIMSLMGAIIIDEPTGSGTGNGSKEGAWRYVEPTISDVSEFIGYANEATGTIKLLKCDEVVDCKNPTTVNKTITSFRAMVSTKMDALRNNLNSRSAQTVADLKLIEVSSVPIWKMIATSPASDTSTIETYKNYIAVDVAYTYVESVLEIAKQISRSGQVQPAAPDAKEALGKLTAQLTDISANLHNKRVEETNKVMRTVELERQLQFQHQAMIAGIPAQAFNSMQVFK